MAMQLPEKIGAMVLRERSQIWHLPSPAPLVFCLPSSRESPPSVGRNGAAEFQGRRTHCHGMDQEMWYAMFAVPLNADKVFWVGLEKQGGAAIGLCF